MAQPATHHARLSLRAAMSAMLSSKLTDCETASSIFEEEDFRLSIKAS